jgi:hypothetical protein
MAVGILQVFRGIRTATRGLIAAPWTPLASLCCREEQRSQPNRQESVNCRALMNTTCYRRI